MLLITQGKAATGAAHSPQCGKKESDGDAYKHHKVEEKDGTG